MSQTSWSVADIQSAAATYQTGASAAANVANKAGESPNIMAYGLTCMGIVGSWMTLAQSDAQAYTQSVQSTLESVTQSLNETATAYDNVNNDALEKIKQVEAIINQLGGSIR